MKTVLEFLAELKENNNKEWFDKNRDRYQENRQKMLFMTELFNAEIHKFDSDIPIVDPKECLFRIFRDVRFSNDKTPYKTNMGSFIAKGGRKSIWPGYYFHLEPGASFVGGGLYMPAADVLKAVRTEIGDNGDELYELLNRKNFKKFFPELYNDQLKTAPKSYPADHKHIDLLKYKSFAVGASLSDQLVSGPDFISYTVESFKELQLVNSYLSDAIHKWM
ncbi:MAG: hypothetical protein A2W90_20505 [Bacteroidetes bacterium GWF2_42_66]|nr:MAG: hypothetical protein A2W92_06370 [Bacteroidetes bacterium GWA2_42_15]OFX98492.1 MAG: hypothetical protein A2W89_08870 [Bacteroidetes bacterium GWE2_42_39]OFY42877.1 MAG: hypothetical protein A2W90_20505 [Bacteroidetes bacterium GWF2_42_66]HBL75326.1 hypothetical protein [Prolixibacteraceae bacterium]HCR91479.1 hypothetical protein [Prolixibacteraceae bacterium]